MRRIRALFLSGLVIVMLLNGWVRPAQSQAKFPSRAVDIIIPYGTGGSVDLSSRIAAVYLKKRWNVPVNVVNKPGGNTVPGSLEMYRAAPDGYTVLGDAPGSTSILVNTVQSLPFNMMDRTFIAMFLLTPNVIMVPPHSPYKTLEDAVTDAKKDPQNFTWGSLGGAATTDIGFRQLFKVIGVDISKTKPIMVESAGANTTLLAGGHAKIGLATASAVSVAYKGGLVKALAITSKSRHPDFPDVPTTAELGYPTVSVATWGGFTGPPKVPSQVVETWDKAVQDMLKDSEVVSQIRNNRSMPYYLNAQDFREWVVKETEEYRKLFGSK